MVKILGQQEETVVFPDRHKQETLLRGGMTSHYFRQKQSCWHYGFGVTLNFTMSSLFPGIPREQQLCLLNLSGISQQQGCTCHPTQSCSLHKAKASEP